MNQSAMNNPMIANMVNKLKTDPRYASNPVAQNMLSAIMTGDAKKGEEIARNLCQTYGVTPEAACQQAMSMFGNFNGR